MIIPSLLVIGVQKSFGGDKAFFPDGTRERAGGYEPYGFKGSIKMSRGNVLEFCCCGATIKVG